MTRVVRNAALFCAAGILVASAALANVPDPAHSSLGSPVSAFIDVEGSTGGNPDNCSDGRCSNYTVTVRDFANNLIAGSTVVIDFSGCPDIQISCDQLNAVTGQTDLAGKKVSGTTNASGQFVFMLQGASNATIQTTNTTSPGTNVNTPCAQVFADGVLLGNLIVAAYDLNGLGSPTGAVNASDAGLCASEAIHIALGAQARARDDYDHNGVVNASDAGRLAGMAIQASLGTGSQKTAPFCP